MSIRDIGQDTLTNIAEYATIGRINDINALGIRDTNIIDRIKMYDRTFSYKQWKEDLDKKRQMFYLMGTEYEHINNIMDMDEYRYTLTTKPTEIERILSTPDTLEEYLNMAIFVNNSDYNRYIKHLTGDWIIYIDWYKDHDLKIKTSDIQGMYNVIELTSSVDPEDGQVYYKIDKRIENDIIIVSETEYAEWYDVEQILFGMLDVINTKYPIRKIEREDITL